MVAELTDLLAIAPETTTRAEFARVIVEENALGKATLATRKLTAQRLAELYGLDDSIPLFRLLRGLWKLDPDARPLLATLVALARDLSCAHPRLQFPGCPRATRHRRMR